MGLVVEGLVALFELCLGEITFHAYNSNHIHRS